MMNSHEVQLGKQEDREKEVTDAVRSHKKWIACKQERRYAKRM